MKLKLKEKITWIKWIQIAFAILSFPHLLHAQTARSCRFVMMSEKQYKLFETKLSKDYSDRVRDVVSAINSYRSEPSPMNFEPVRERMSQLKKISPSVAAYLHDLGTIDARTLIEQRTTLIDNRPSTGFFDSFVVPPLDLSVAFQFHDNFVGVMAEIDRILDASSAQPKMGFNSAYSVLSKLHEDRNLSSTDTTPLNKYGINNNAVWVDDSSHSTKSFDPKGRYFVFTFDLNPESWIIKNSNVLMASIGGFKVSDQYWMDVVSRPADLAKKPFVTLSYLGPGKRATYRSIGFVVWVPPENILRTRPKDYGSLSFAGEKEISFFLSNPEIMEPVELLANTSHKVNNEVHVYGTHPRTGRSVQVVGMIFNPNFSVSPKAPSGEEIKNWTAWSIKNGYGKPHTIDDGTSFWAERDFRDLELIIAKKIEFISTMNISNDSKYWQEIVKQKIKIIRTAQGETIIDLEGMSGIFAFDRFFSEYFEIVKTEYTNTENLPYFKIRVKKLATK